MNRQEYLSLLRLMSQEITRPEYELAGIKGKIYGLPNHLISQALVRTSQAGKFQNIPQDLKDMVVNGIIWEACLLMNWDCPANYQIRIRTIERWVDEGIRKTARDASIPPLPTHAIPQRPVQKAPAEALVITSGDLSWLCESTVLTITNDRNSYKRAQVSLRERGSLSVGLCQKAIKASGDELWELYNKLRTPHRQIIRNRMAVLVNEQMDQLMLRRNITAIDLDAIAKLYQPSCDWSGLEKRVKNHITAGAFNAMSEDEQVSWLSAASGHIHKKSTSSLELNGKSVDGLIDFKVLKSRTATEELKAWRWADKSMAPNFVHSIDADVFAKMHMGHFHVGRDEYASITEETTRRKRAHLAEMYGAQSKRINEILNPKPEKTMNTSTKSRNLTEVFGVVITGMDKSSLMNMIRKAKAEVAEFADLDQSSEYVKGQVKTIDAGIKKLYTELDK